MTSASIQLERPNSIQDSVETLRQILSKEQLRKISYAEAAEISDSLVTFFEALAATA